MPRDDLGNNHMGDTEQITKLSETLGHLPTYPVEDTRKILFSLYKHKKREINSLQEELDQSKSQAARFANDYSKASEEASSAREELATAHAQLKRYAVDLRSTVQDLRKTNRELQRSYYDTIRRLVIASEYKDRDTGYHITRISRYSALLAEKLRLERATTRTILYASPMHDVGKIGIPDRILLKKDRLLEPEFALMKTHTVIGANILANSHARILETAHQIALYHHECWDGSGYPEGLAGESIPLPARIVGLVDVFDALTSRRPYKDPYPVEVSCEIIRRESGRRFSPRLVEIFLGNLQAILTIKSESTDSDSEPATGSFTLSKRDQELEDLAQLYR